MRLHAGIAAVLLAFAGGCGSDETAYERAVAELEPIYCYRSIGDADCYRTPNFRDERRLINFYGPPPRRYAPPPPPPKARLDPPPALDAFAGPAGEARVRAAAPEAPASPSAESLVDP
jgi:hypothetical protein